MPKEFMQEHTQDIKQESEQESRTVPVWHKAAITLTEASRYSSIGERKLREITDDPNCSFVFWVGRKRLIKRKLFDKYIDSVHVI